MKTKSRFSLLGNMVAWVIAFLLVMGFTNLIIWALELNSNVAFWLNAAGLVVWGLIMSALIERCLIRVPFQKAWVTLNILTKEKRILREGLNLIGLFDRIQTDKEISLIFKELCGSPNMTSKDSTPLKGKWKMLVAPDPDNLETFIQFETAAIFSQLSAHNDEFLSDSCGIKDANEIMKERSQIAADLALVYEGEGKPSPLEKKMGVICKNPELESIEQDSKVLADKEKARAIGKKVDAVSAAAIQMVKDARSVGDEKLSYTEASEKVTLLSEEGQSVRRDILKFEGIPHGIQNFSIGGHGGGGSWREKRKNKEGGDKS